MKKYICLIFSIVIIGCARDASRTKSEAFEEAAETDYEFMIEVDDEDAKDVIIEDTIEVDGYKIGKGINIEEMELNESDMDFLTNDGLGFSMPSNPLVELTEQKLKEYFDLIQLKKEHPEFKEDIILQLQKFSNDSTIGLNYAQGFKLENIRIANYLERNTDSIQKLKLYFDVIEGQTKLKDSIYAYIDQKQTKIDNKETTSYKIRFKKSD